MNSTVCSERNTWVDCSLQSFQCQALRDDPGLLLVHVQKELFLAFIQIFSELKLQLRRKQIKSGGGGGLSCQKS